MLLHHRLTDITYITEVTDFKGMPLALYTDLLTPLLVACSTNIGKGLIKLVMYSEMSGRHLEKYRIVGNFVGSKFVLCYLQLIHAFNFRSVHFTQENTPIIMYISCV